MVSSDILDSVLSNVGPRVANPASLLKFTDLDPGVQRHLVKVYLTLCGCLATCTAGCYLGMQFASLLIASQLVAFGCLLGLAFTQPLASNTNKRYLMLGGFSFAQGCSLAPLVAYASNAFPGVVMTALLSTTAVFLCFTLSALMTRRRTYLFLGGYLSSAILGMLALRLGGWLLGRPSWGFDLELYGGILVFSGWILFDTQVIIEKAYGGNMDHIRHAQELLVDVLALFVRILVLLLKNASKKEEEEKKRKKRS